MLQPAERPPTQLGSPLEAATDAVPVTPEIEEAEREQAYNERLRATYRQDHDPTWRDYERVRLATPQKDRYDPFAEFTDSGQRRPARRTVDAEPAQLVVLRRLIDSTLEHSNSSVPIARHLYEEHRELAVGEQPVTTGQLRELSEKIEWLMPRPNSARSLTPTQQTLLVWTVHGAIVNGRRQVPKPLANLLDEHPHLDRAAAGNAIRHALARLCIRDPKKERRILGSND